MLDPRWRKVLRDLWGSKARTVLVVLSIAVGVFAVDIASTDFPLNYTFSFKGALLWLVVVLILSALASFLPSRSASLLTVREVLAYE